MKESRQFQNMSRIALALALAASLFGNVFLYLRWSEERDEVPYFVSERPAIDEAIRLFAVEGGQMTNRFPVAVPAPDPQKPDELLTCVSLKLRSGMTGWTPVYCFDRKENLKRRLRV